MAQTDQSSEQAVRFLSEIARLTQQDSDATIGAPAIGLAISGGPDSMALLWLMQCYYDGAIYAATVDHGLRKEAADEALYVSDICKTLNIPHAILTPTMPIAGNIQSNARKARYALLHQWAAQKGCAYIATAHHADDQLETMIMRLNRASGVAGLASIRARNGQIIRPLLGYRKSELIQICTAAGIETINDPSNSNDDYDRVKIRQGLEKCESLGLSPIIDPIMAQKSAAHLDDAESALQFSAALLAKERIEKIGDNFALDIANLPLEYQRRLLTQALAQMDESIKPRGVALDNAIKSLNDNIISMIGDIKITPKIDDKASGAIVWTLSKAPPRGPR